MEEEISNDCDSSKDLSYLNSEIKEKLKVSNQREIFLPLTSTPGNWSNRKVAKEFKASRGAITKVRKLKNASGILSMPSKQTRKSIPVEFRPKVLGFFRKDTASRMLPGKKVL